MKKIKLENPIKIDGVELIEIDPINMTRNINGSDQLSKIKEILQI